MTIELQLINLAQKIADMYSNKITQTEYEALCNAIQICQEYHLEHNQSWIDMYEVILYDNGIWQYSESLSIDENLRNMWMLETDILICNCYLGCIAERSNVPQDMEIQEDNIPKFIDVLENCITNKIDFETIFEFWKESMCY